MKSARAGLRASRIAQIFGFFHLGVVRARVRIRNATYAGSQLTKRVGLTGEERADFLHYPSVFHSRLRLLAISFLESALLWVCSSRAAEKCF